MREFKRIAGAFYEPIKIIGGPDTRAIVARPPDIDQPGVEFAAPSLTLRAQRDGLLRAGQVVRTQGGEHYILAKHNETVDWRTLHMFWCDRQVVWTRPGTTTDRLTGLKVAGTSTPQGTIYVMWERVRREFTELALRVSQERHLVATGADVKIGDALDNMIVDRVSNSLGVRILELRG
jgi:hypothetical protein